MKRWIKAGIAVPLIMVPLAAAAEISGTVTVTSDYDYRGISQTATDPALQGSLDYSHASGFYASALGSSLDWGSGSETDVEIDYFAGFSRDFGESGVSWDLGVLAYTYPGLSTANFVEYYGGLGYGGFDIKVSYSDDFAGVGESGWYINGGYTYEWENGFSALVYGGYSFGNAFDDHPHRGLPLGFPAYWNYGFGAGYSMEHFYFELKVVGTDLSGEYKVNNGVFANDFRAILTVTASFP